MTDKSRQILIGKKVPVHGGVTMPIAIPSQTPPRISDAK